MVSLSDSLLEWFVTLPRLTECMIVETVVSTDSLTDLECVQDKRKAVNNQLRMEQAGLQSRRQL